MYRGRPLDIVTQAVFIQYMHYQFRDRTTMAL